MMSTVDLTTFLLLALAVYRLSHMVTNEEGPFELFATLRDALGGNQQATWVGRGIVCILCVSFWVEEVRQYLRAWPTESSCANGHEWEDDIDPDGDE